MQASLFGHRSIADTGERAACVFCGNAAEGNFTIHRDGFSVGPVVPLCDVCGCDEEPTAADIWDKIAQPAAGPFAHVQSRSDRRSIVEHFGDPLKVARAALAKAEGRTP